MITSNELRNGLGLDATRPTVGWHTYLGPTRNAGGELGRPFGPGTLISVGEDWHDVDTADVARVAAALDGVGALGPIA